MTQENLRFKPSLIGRLFDATITAPPVAPFDILVSLKKAEGPYEAVLRGKVTDPDRANQATENYNQAYMRLYNWIHRDDPVG